MNMVKVNNYNSFANKSSFRRINPFSDNNKIKSRYNYNYNNNKNNYKTVKNTDDYSIKPNNSVKTSPNFALQKVTCSKCKRRGHYANKCNSSSNNKLINVASMISTNNVESLLCLSGTVNGVKLNWLWTVGPLLVLKYKI